MVDHGRLPVSYTYLEPSGLIKTVTSPRLGSTDGTMDVTTYTYDFEVDPTQNHGRIVKVQRPGAGAISTAIDNYSYNYSDDNAYDINGNPGTYHNPNPNDLPLTVTDAKGRTQHYRYDANGNVTLEIDEDGWRCPRALDVHYETSYSQFHRHQCL